MLERRSMLMALHLAILRHLLEIWSMQLLRFARLYILTSNLFVLECGSFIRDTLLLPYTHWPVLRLWSRLLLIWNHSLRRMVRLYKAVVLHLRHLLPAHMITRDLFYLLLQRLHNLI